MSDKPCPVSAILLSFNSGGTIVEALHGVLGQDCEPMEVIVSDDASTDDTYAILRAELQQYAGPHRVVLRRRALNSGSKSAHLNDVFPRTHGQILVSFDGDDVSEPFRVRRILEAFDEGPGVAAVYSGYSLMATESRPARRGTVPHAPPGVSARQWFARVDAYASGTTLAVRRDVVEAFGPLDPAINEDVVLPFRASLLGAVRHLDEDLVRVRRWPGSLTADHDRFLSLDRYRAWMLRGVARAHPKLASRLEDLHHAERLGLVDEAELQALQRIARASLADAEATAGLVSPSLPARILCLARLVRTGAYRHELPLNAFLTFAPGLYLRYKRRRL